MTRIQMQADDFFNAYLVLKANNEAIIEKQLGTRPTQGVEIVCLAFSLELYIKNLHFVVSGKKAPRDHNILKLFEKLPEEIRQKIFACDSICRNPFITRGTAFSAKKFSPDYSDYDGFIDYMKTISDGFEK